jgi:hypothetical protein
MSMSSAGRTTARFTATFAVSTARATSAAAASSAGTALVGLVPRTFRATFALLGRGVGDFAHAIFHVEIFIGQLRGP